MSSAVRALGAGGNGRHLRTSLGEVFVAERGTGAPVVALHAIGHGSGDFLPLADRVGSHFRLSMVDWPGHGDSPRGLPPSAKNYAALLAELVPSIAREPVVLLGNSVGGAAALRFAASRPDLVRALVLCDPGGLAPVGAFERLAIGAFVRFFEAGARGARWFPALFRAYYRVVLPEHEAALRRARICEASGETAALLADAWRSFREPEADLRATVARVKVPVWLAWSKGDRIIPWRASRKAAEAFSDHALTMFRGGHCPFLEDPDRFARELTARFAVSAPRSVSEPPRARPL